MSQATEAIKYHLSINTGAIRLLTIRRGLKLEIAIPGMRLTARAPKCSTILRKEFGLKGKPASLLAQFEGLLDAAGIEYMP